MIEIIGGNDIEGEVKISGSKNTALPIICASLLTRGRVILDNVPRITDVLILLDIIRDLNVMVEFVENKVYIDSTNIKYKMLLDEKVKKIRGSSYLLSVMLVLFKKVELAYPGGCSLGNRGLNYHIEAFRKLGVTIYEDEYIEGYCDKIEGKDIAFKEKSVGTTINTIILAGLSSRVVKIYNYAKEPEVMHTINFLKSIGYKIYEFKDYLLVAGKGVNKKKIKYKIPFDRIEAISYMMLGMKSKGVCVKNIEPSELSSVFKVIDEMDGSYELKKNRVMIKKTKLKGVSITASSYPAFPTDAQPLIAPVLLDANGESTIKDTIYPTRFNYAKSLKQMNAKVSVESNILTLNQSELKGSVVKGYDLRGVFSLIVAASTALGKSTILDGDLAFRGYESLIFKLTKLGIRIKDTK